MPEFHAETPQATMSEGLAQGPYVAARAGVKPMTLRTKGVDSTKAPPRPTISCRNRKCKPTSTLRLIDYPEYAIQNVENISMTRSKNN